MLTRQKRSLFKEKLKRIKFRKNLLHYNFLKFLLHSKILTTQVQIFIFYYFTVFFNLTSLTTHKNICFNTYYKKSVNTFLKLNRLQAIKQISKLKLPGFSLAKW